MKKCPQCNKEIKNRHNKFCNSSCSASYNNIRKPKKVREKFKCLACGKENEKRHSKISRNKFCNSVCSGKYRKVLTKERFKNGEVSHRNTMRKILSEEIGYECAECGISEWNNNPITLQVDHKDGNPGNHELSNVQLLCPNCHTQQATWGGRNKGNGRKSRGLPLY